MKYRVILLAVVVFAMILTGCTTTQKGALGGAALGAGTGALIGHNTHHGSGEGAIYGAVIGGLVGALAGDAYEDYSEKRDMRRRHATEDYSRGQWADYEDMWE